MRNFSSSFEAAKNKKASQPVNLLQIDWPGMNGLPAFQARLTDRALTIEGTDWLALVTDWGLLENGGNFSLDGELRLTLLNAPVDFGRGVERFSDILKSYPAETATATVYQWFEDEGLTAGDKTELMTARLIDPVEFDASFCSFRLVGLMEFHGRTVVGNAITATEYPNVPESSVGKIKPVVIGQVDRTPGVLVRDVLKTRLTSVAVLGGTTLDVAATENFPATGSVLVNDDDVTYTGATATQFTGCSGINDYHYADDEVIEQATDHRYLFSDSAYPVADIRNVRVAGDLADASLYSVDLANGEVVFNQKPRRVESIDTRFLQAQFDAVATGNSAVDPLNAADPNARTQYAQISQVNPLLKLQQTTVMANIGTINKVFLRVEHFVEEKLPNDTVVARLEGLGQVGILSPPADADAALTTGFTDITHTHLDTLGFPVNNPNHLHIATSEADHVEEQGLSAGGGDNYHLTGPFDTGPFSVAVTFPPPPAGTVLKAEYKVRWKLRSITFSIGTPTILFGPHIIAQWNASRFEFDHTPTFTNAGGAGGNTWSFTLNTGSMFFDILSVERLLFYPPLPATQSNNLDTVKGGNVTQHNSSPPLSATTDKTTQTVVDLFDITSLVNADWNWFTNQKVEVEYTGNLDGRTAYVIHTAFEIEYARRRMTATDEVTADVDGIKDDALGTITGTANGLIERPDHVFLWSLLNLLGEDISGVDLASFSTAGGLFATAINGGYRLAGRLQEKTLLRDLWVQWMKESRSSLFWDALGKARLIFRPFNDSSNVLGSAVKTIDENVIRQGLDTAGIVFQRTASDQAVNHIELNYLRDWRGRDYGRVEIVTDTALADLFGKREQPERFLFDWCRLSVQAQDLAQFYLKALGAPQTLAECDVFLDQLELEQGDIVTLTHSLGNLNNIYGTVLPGNHRLGSGLRHQMDSLLLRVRLFPMEFLVDQLSETTHVAETAQAVEAGWGVQSWGVTSWGGRMQL